MQFGQYFTAIKFYISSTTGIICLVHLTAYYTGVIQWSFSIVWDQIWIKTTLDTHSVRPSARSIRSN